MRRKLTAEPIVRLQEPPKYERSPLHTSCVSWKAEPLRTRTTSLPPTICFPARIFKSVVLPEYWHKYMHKLLHTEFTPHISLQSATWGTVDHMHSSHRIYLKWIRCSFMVDTKHGNGQILEMVMEIPILNCTTPSHLHEKGRHKVHSTHTCLKWGSSTKWFVQNSVGVLHSV